MSEERYLTAPEMGEILHVSADTVRRRAEAGEIPGVRVGRQWRFLAAEVKDHLRLLASARDPWARSAASRRALNRRRAA
jgi:excisionase family DNA binding protein